MPERPPADPMERAKRSSAVVAMRRGLTQRLQLLAPGGQPAIQISTPVYVFRDERAGGGMRWTRRPFRLAGAWVAVAVGGFVGIGGGLLAQPWFSAGWAASIGGALAAVSAVVTARANQSIETYRRARKDLPDNINLHGRQGGFPRVRDVTDLVSVGVHPAEKLADGQERVAEQPRYISRDFDHELRSAIDRGGFVVLVGESTAGKSRAAFESLLVCRPSHIIAAPSGRESLSVIAGELSERRCWVLWLDDLERFLGAGGLTPAMLDRLTGHSDRGAVVVSTMRLSEYDRFTGRFESDTNVQDQAAWRASREVLGRARVVFADRLWSPPELARASKHGGDPRIVRALNQASAFGIAETLTAGPVLLRDWRNAWSPAAHPRGAALVAAAVDCRRAGLDAPVTRELLVELHDHYLTARGGHALRPEGLDEAWRWTLQPVHGASSLILPAGPTDEEQRFIAFDYLLDQPDNAPVPPETWTLLISRADPAQVVHIVAKAYWRSPVSFHVAVESEIVNDVFSLSTAAANLGDFSRAINLLRAEQQARNGDSDVDWSLRHQIAFYQMLSGDVAAAEPTFIALLAEVEAELPPDDEYLQVVRHNIASCHRRRGDLQGALALFRHILAEREQYLGPLAMNTLATRSAIASLIAEGDVREAIQQLRAVLADENRALGPDHINTLDTRGRLVDLLAEAGDLDEAIELSHALLPDLVRAYGHDYPEVREAEVRHKNLADSVRDSGATELPS